LPRREHRDSLNAPEISDAVFVLGEEAISNQLSAISCQRSAVSGQLSAVSFQLKTREARRFLRKTEG
jgi:hypothetical protein